MWLWMSRENRERLPGQKRNEMKQNICENNSIKDRKNQVAVIMGDGVGPEMMRPALKVLEKICNKHNKKIEIAVVEAAGDAVMKYGDPLPEDSVRVCRESDAVLFGNSGLSKFNDYPLEKRPEYALLKLRRELKVTTNIRPVHMYPKLTELSPLKEEKLKKGMDMVFVRDIVGGVLCSEKVKGEGAYGSEAYEYEYYNEEMVRQTADIAFSLAYLRRKKVVSLDKANVLGSSRLWRKTVQEVGEQYKNIELSNCYIDSASMNIIREPWNYDVVLSSNMFGDIIADEGTELTGTPFLYGSAEISAEGKGIYTPNQLHWADERVAGKQIVNPIGMISAVALMLEFSFGMNREAWEIEYAISKVIEKGYATQDVMTSDSTRVGTDEMAALIMKEIDNI